MDYYLDENLPERVSKSLNALDDENRIQFITKVAPRGTKDIQLIDKLNDAHADVIVTNDEKFHKRMYQFRKYKENNMSVFIISFAKGADYWVKVKAIILKWELVLKISRKEQHPFICKIFKKKNPNSPNPEYEMLN